MKHVRKVFFCSSVLIFSLIILQFFQEENDFEVFVDKSIPYIGALYPIESGFDGTGITIAVIILELIITILICLDSVLTVK